MSPLATQAALSALQSAPPAAPQKTANAAAAQKAAKTFEGIFIAQMLQPMFDSIPTDGPFGGGSGEEMFRSLMVDQFGQQIANSSSFGLSDAMTRSLLQHQTVKS
ncbi:MAG: rod-binding protein [Alphaproteobacteria bacterium]|nr:rod-binding protein [Alphaproteobacteria bacterium]MDE2014254.1 rod-binding protein [Alphaproteobacteria bacterium]MDE2074227.1 rod-binding protein [Alphaproteobacteria bacterium]MDE2352241.1 rod-binding protein [Alphaproteobacteria bacterium]